MPIEQGISNYVCDLSGLSGEGIDFDPAEDDQLGDMPPGWTLVQIQTRIANPRYDTLIKARSAALTTMMAQSGVEEGDEEGRGIVEVMVEAQFLPLLEREPPFLTEEAELVIHPQYLKELYLSLGLTEEEVVVPSISPLTDEDEEDDEDEEEEAEAVAS